MNDGEQNRHYRMARALTLVPPFVFVVMIVCFAVAFSLEESTNTPYDFFLLVGLLSFFLSPTPCLVMALVGTISAVKSDKAAVKESRHWITLGVIEILLSIAWAALACISFIHGTRL